MKPEQRRIFSMQKMSSLFTSEEKQSNGEALKGAFLPPEISSWDLFDGKVQRQSDREDVRIERWRQGMLEE